MIEQGFEIHGWLWSSVFVLPIALLAVYRVVERWDRSGDIRRSGLLFGAIYAGAILWVAPFAAAMLHVSPLVAYIPGVGGLAYDPLYLGAFLTFALVWVEPEMERLKPVRGFLKLLVLLLVLQTGIWLWAEGPPLEPVLGSGTTPEWRAGFVLSVWAVLTAGVHSVYRIAWKRWVAIIAMFALILMISTWSLIRGGPVFGGFIAIASLALLPLALAFARTSCWDLREMGWRRLYGLGVWQLPLVGYLRTKPWREEQEQDPVTGG